MSRSVAAWVLTVSTLLCCGCASQANKTYPPVSPDSVKFYMKPPNGSYQRIGMVMLPVTPEIRWDDRGDSPKGIAMLREKAAAMGANGILTELKPDEYNITALVGDGKGNWYQVPIRTTEPRTAVGMAIHVDE